MLTRTIVFYPTQADVLSASRLNYLASVRQPRFLVRLLIGLAVLSALAGAVQWYMLGIGIAWFALVGRAYWLGIVALIIGLRFLLLPVTVKRLYAQQKALHDDIGVEWSDEGVSVTSSRGTVRHPWSDFVAVYANRRAIVLRQSDALFNFVPRRALSDEQANDLLRVARG